MMAQQKRNYDASPQLISRAPAMEVDSGPAAMRGASSNDMGSPPLSCRFFLFYF
jgi:hypothetical protein